MTELAPFVPRLAVELAASPGNLALRRTGSMLSADISGFTALTERLADRGKAGAEEITVVVNECFTALIDAAYAHGGEVLKFGGDALLIMFLGDDHPTRCAAAGVAMQAALRATTAARRAHLTMTVGAESGDFDLLLCGSSHRELIVTGATADRVIDLEAAAASGEVLVGDTLAAALPPAALTGGTSEVGGVTVGDGVAIAPVGPVQRPGGTGVDWSSLVPVAVARQLDAVEVFEGEHRIVSIGFIQVRGVGALMAAEGADAVAADLGAIVDRVVEATGRFDCTLLHTDIAPDGLKFLLAAGAPLSTGNDEDSLIHTLQEALGGRQELSRRAGAARGRVFAGFLGAPYRRAYTTMGDATNTAARLLPAAGDGELVVQDGLLRHATTELVTESLPPVAAKGKREPLVAHRVVSATTRALSRRSDLALVGRDDELALLRAALAAGGRTVELIGPAGVGKSRLVDAVVQEAGAAATVAACSPYSSFTPYALARPLVRIALGLDLGLDRRACGPALTALVERVAPDLVPMVPLLAIPVGADVAPTPEADRVDPASRRSVAHRLVFEVIDRLPAAEGVVVVVEDVQWIDDASGELLGQLVREAPDRGWVVVVARRPNSHWTADGLPESTSIRVGPLSAEAVRALAIEAASEALPDHALDRVIDQAAGNPLFAIELARAYSADGELPETVESVIATRLDRLAPHQRRLLRIASVLGAEVAFSDLGAVTSVVAPDLDPTDLAGLGDLVEPTDHGLSFVHALYRDTAYEGLPYRQRRRLHQLVGERLEDRAADEVDDAPVLALHFSEGGVYEKAWHYAVIAARRARDQAANVEAAEAYRRALEATAHHRVDVDAVAAVAEDYGDTCLALGRFDDAFRAFSRARRLRADLVDRVRLMRKLGLAREREGALSTSLRWLTRAMKLIPADTDDVDLIGGRAALELAYSGVRHRQGRNDACARWARLALADAERSGDLETLGRALDRLHLASIFDPSVTDGPDHAHRALAIHEQRGDYTSLARTLVNLGVQMHYAHRWDEALDHYGRAARAGERAGDVIEANIGRMNRAEILSDRGHYDEAEEEFTEVVRNWTAAAWRYGELVSRSNLALCRVRRGEKDPAITTDELAEVLRGFRDLAADEYVTETTLRLAEAQVLQGDAAAGLLPLGGLAESATDPKIVARAHRITAMAAMLLDELETAAEHLRLARAAALEGRARYEEGSVWRVVAELARRRGDPEGETRALAEAREVLAPLGVVSVAGMPVG